MPASVITQSLLVPFAFIPLFPPILLHSLTFKIVTVFPEATAICLRTGDQATAAIGSSEEIFVINVGTVLDVAAQIASVPSWLPVAKKRASGDQDMARIGAA